MVAEKPGLKKSHLSPRMRVILLLLISVTVVAVGVYLVARSRERDIDLLINRITTSRLPKTIEGADGAPMVLIPGGKIQIGGSDIIQKGGSDGISNRSTYTEYLKAFYMDEHEVTNAQYAKFLNAKPEWFLGIESLDCFKKDCLIERIGNGFRPKKGYENYPAILVTWQGASNYAAFYGKQLPCEAEWEKAARGGLVGKKYPWGDDIDPSQANFANFGGIGKGLKPVGSFPPNGYGLYDMVGNVAEWCSGYEEKTQDTGGFGRFVLQLGFVRGGSWDDSSYYLQIALHKTYPILMERRFPDSIPTVEYYDRGMDDLGFRCVEYIPQKR